MFHSKFIEFIQIQAKIPVVVLFVFSPLFLLYFPSFFFPFFLMFWKVDHRYWGFRGIYIERREWDFCHAWGLLSCRNLAQHHSRNSDLLGLSVLVFVQVVLLSPSLQPSSPSWQFIEHLTALTIPCCTYWYQCWSCVSAVLVLPADNFILVFLAWSAQTCWLQ